MIWSKLKKRVESFFAPEAKGRIELRATRYHDVDRTGRGYITIDGQEIINMAHYTFWKEERPRIDAIAGSLNLSPAEAQGIADAELHAEGIFSLDGFYSSLEQYLDSSIEDSLASSNVLIRALAMIDNRVGKRRLSTIDVSKEHPMVRRFYEIRTNRA